MLSGNVARGVIAAVTFAAFAGLHGGAMADERLDLRRDAVVRVVEKTSDAIVNISTEQVVERGFFPPNLGHFADPFFDQFMRQFSRPEIAHSLGTGGIFTSDGFIFTNAHVLDRASKIVVTLADGSQFSADLISVDVATDVAVIKINAGRELPTLTLGRSDDLLVGEKAIAVGNPFGLTHTVTTGVISATHRDVVEDGRVIFKDFLQTDALINPGNSGGPLFNIFGEVIGVNTAMRAGGQGIGFAIPIDRVKSSLASLLDYGKLRRWRIGLSVEETYTGSGPETIVVVKSVDEGGPAAAAGFAVGDRVTDVGGRKVRSLVEFIASVLVTKSGTDVEITVERDGDPFTAAFRPAEMPKPDGARLASEMLGLSVQQMGRNLSRHVGIDIDKGVLVTNVDRGSAAAARIAAGDVILQVNNTLTADLDTFASALEAAKAAPTVQLVILRREGNAYYQFAVEIPVTAPDRI